MHIFFNIDYRKSVFPEKSEKDYAAVDFMNIFGDISIIFDKHIINESQSRVIVDLLQIICAINYFSISKSKYSYVPINDYTQIIIEIERNKSQSYLNLYSRDKEMLLERLKIETAFNLSNHIYQWLENMIMQNQPNMIEFLRSNIVSPRL